jgi:1-acylglycerone phosphate reductase
MAGIYNISKAATAMLTDTLRLELAPFGIKVVDLKTGAVKSNFFDNQVCPHLPEGNIYMPAREAVEAAMRGVGVMKDMMDREK